MPSCVIKSCKSDTRKHTKPTGITFHEFPHSAKRREEWTKAILFTRDPDWRPSKRSSICSLHFHESDFYTTNKGLRRLKKTAIPKYKLLIHSGPSQYPEIFEIHQPSTSTQGSQQTTQLVNEVICTETSTDVAMDVDISSTLEELTNKQSMENITMSSLPHSEYPESYHTPPRPLQTNINSPISSHSDINSYLETPKKHALKLKLRKKTLLADLRLKKLKKLQRINRKLIKQNYSLQEIINDLKNKRYITSDVEQKLSKSNVVVAEIFNRMYSKIKKRKRTTVKFPASIRKFALTLDFLSPAGYKYVRRVFDSCLPHPSTLNKWYQNIDGNPGFSEEAFRALKDKLVATTDRKLRFCLIVDEMAIRQKKIFNGKFMEGLVSFGENTEEIATQAYCLILVPINDSFKLPLGYFLVNGFSSDQKANIITRALEKCHDAGAMVVTLTFDGCTSNFAAAKDLGCELDDINKLKTHFPHPSHNGTKVCLILDPCHMIKLIRNTLESKKEFIDSDGKSINWQYLVELQKYQDNLGLHFANKITEQHIKFRNQIMKVKLATQLFSSSVASALDLCENELGLPMFNKASATANLVQKINDLFDVLNSRSIKDFGFKQPLCAENKEQQYKLLDDAEEYLKTLKLKVPIKKVKMHKKKKIQ